ncbi:translocation/assembly module TamB domain-containing protein [Tannerella forsythia]|uniref:translocation/assembly module TamB domain-containing protein n=1 Tax=Tannerella forsythia TaxID=28112 RepID=UPI0009C187DC|nr:translocation/assembly module TamB domain-containing protein [Tannerella forsythia]
MAEWANDFGRNKQKPSWNGHLQLDSAFAYVTAAGTEFRFDDRKVDVKNSKIRFNKYSIHTNGNNPFVINGIVDISRPMHETVNLRLTANNMQLLDTRKEPGSMIYGKMLVDLNTTLKGPLRAMYMRGDLHVLGSTNLTYVVPESKLESRDNFADLVTFTYFSDTIPKRRRWGETLSTAETVQPLPSVGSMDMLMTVRIDPVVRLKIDLGGEQSNRIELKGGGDLSFQYTSLGDMRLNGRYTISDGLVRYSIPVIPLTDFTIRDGSYVEWRGNPMNPFLNLTALSRLRSSVNLDGQSQMVDFNTGIQVRQELQKMALKFILEAPNNGAVQNQLAAMGEEERSKQAISLLVTGVYLAGDGAGTERMDVGAALSSLLQREINNMLGSLLGEVPFSFDVNTYDGTDGKGRRIDYLGRFYKGFMNDRLYTTLGMRYSTNDPVTGDRFYVDDASLEYRLDTEGSRFIRIFSQKDYENLFEGEIRKSGGEVIFRRKTRRFGDLFDFRRQPAIRKEDDSYRNEPENDSSEKNEEEQEKDE